jgi:hypothetical protein
MLYPVHGFWMHLRGFGSWHGFMEWEGSRTVIGRGSVPVLLPSIIKGFTELQYSEHHIRSFLTLPVTLC